MDRTLPVQKENSQERARNKHRSPPGGVMRLRNRLWPSAAVWSSTNRAGFKSGTEARRPRASILSPAFISSSNEGDPPGKIRMRFGEWHQTHNKRIGNMLEKSLMLPKEQIFKRGAGSRLHFHWLSLSRGKRGNKAGGADFKGNQPVGQGWGCVSWSLEFRNKSGEVSKWWHSRTRNLTLMSGYVM